MHDDDIKILSFKPAQRKGSHVIISLYGPSGGGKTLSALLLARGLVGPDGRIGFIDTETGRGLIYAAEAGGFDHAELTAPWSPDRYMTAIRQAEAEGYGALIIDSASHEWDDIGGVLEMAESGGGKGLQKWKVAKGQHKRFVQTLLRTRMHLILCLRAKEKIVERVGADGKKELVNIGFVPIQAKDFIYDTTVQLFMLNEPGKRGMFHAEKCPRDLLGAFDETKPITIETGAKVAEWVAGGRPVDGEFEALSLAGEDAADSGTAALRTWFESLSRPQQRRMKPMLDGNLKSIALAADRRIREEAEDRAEHQAGGEVETRAAMPAFLAGAIDQVRACAGVSALADVQRETLKELLAAKTDAKWLDHFNTVCRERFDQISAEAA